MACQPPHYHFRRIPSFGTDKSACVYLWDQLLHWPPSVVMTLLFVGREFRLGEGEDLSPCARPVVDEFVVWALHFYQCSDSVRRFDGEGVVGCLDVN
jgi:hypothetical protein